ncbi:MAG: hypothetical protein QOD01_704, partial [Actinomycetota bacterium]|nr:hypothetical protein [Actinomycetota bacterium]
SDVVLLTIQRLLTPWAKPAEVRQSVETVVPAAMAGS